MDISSMSKKQRQEWINALNKCMEEYDKDIEYRMEMADEAERRAIRQKTKIPDQKLIQMRREKKEKRENDEREEI